MRNSVIINGIVDSELEYSHTTNSVKFYKFYVRCKFDDGKYDLLPCIASEIFTINQGDSLQIVGQIRTRNNEDGKSIDTFILVDGIFPYVGSDSNNVAILGTVCKKRYHEFKVSGIIVTTLIVACNRLKGCKTDYIPCVFYGTLGKRALKKNVGDKVFVCGEFQDRDFPIKNKDGEIVSYGKTYEVNCRTLKGVRNEKN